MRGGSESAATLRTSSPSRSAWCSAERSTVRMMRIVFGLYPAFRFATHKAFSSGSHGHGMREAGDSGLLPSPQVAPWN